ncbi:hypothetical protein SLS64_007759 [Diaporthe eres]|uniref:F-box domain-containing protein n=1 Tax=Diaporthe eres TaxID=83184 RepID=A0ABR1NN37_DIAER
MPPFMPLKRTHDEAGLVETCSQGHLQSLDELRLYIPPIETLPQELLLQVFEQLVHPSLVTAGFPDKHVMHYSDINRYQYLEDSKPDRYGPSKVDDRMLPIDRKDLRNVCLVSRKFKMAATTLLYRCACLATAKSPGSFLLTLTAHPDLQTLVRHISVPRYINFFTDRFDFAFSHDTTNWGFGNQDYPIHDELEVADCGEYVGGGLLRLTMPLVPNLRTLIIPQNNLLDGPFTQDLVLPYLTMLRITLMTPNEATFFSYDFSHAVRTITWLSPDFIGHHFPALQRLEICSPNGRWEADLVSEEVERAEGRCLWKYVESLRTKTTCPWASADWDLMSLVRPIFHPSKFHTLEFDGPGESCEVVFGRVADIANWNFNRFFTEKGDGLRTLSLDWELRDVVDDRPPVKNHEEIYFGNMRCLTTLHKLSNLTHLTVSLQALFGIAGKFQDWVDNTKASPDTELARLFPPSLRTLRIAEYTRGVYEPSWCQSGDEHEEEYVGDWVGSHSSAVYRFLQALRAFWLLRDERRELWFRRYAALDQFASENGRPMGRYRLTWILDDTTESDGGFERVLRPPEDMVWVPEGDDDGDDDPDWDNEETTDGSDDGMTEDEDKDPDGEKVGLYQDGKLVLV